MGQFAMTKSAAIALLAAYGNQIEAASEETIVMNIIDRLEEQAEQVEKLAKDAYRSLGCTGNNLEDMERQLSNKLIDLKKETINLNGINLEKGLLETFQESNMFKYDLQKQYNSFINYIIQQTNSVVENNLPSVGEAALAALWGTTTSSFKTDENGILRFGKGVKINGKSMGGKFIGKFNQVYSELGGPLKDRFIQYYKDNKIMLQNFQSTINGTNAGFQVEADWESIPVEGYLQMTKDDGDRERFFKEHPDMKEKILNKYRQKILDNCLNVKRPDLFSQALDRVMFAQLNEKDVDAFFGLTGKTLVGRLGEVQALYYMLVLTDGRGSVSKWVGGIKNPHADELLSSYLGEFGIQVKNTISGDNEFEVNFQKFGLTSKGGKNKSAEKVKIGNKILPALFEYSHTSKATSALVAASDELFGANGILPGQYELIEAIETILGMYTFNIEYLWHNDDTKPRFYASSNPDFSEVRDRIEELAKKANQVMSLMAITTMYMQTAKLSKGQANTLYLIGGGTIISTATILRQIAEDVRANVEYAKSHFKMGTSGSSTIVDVLNGGKEISNLDFALQSSYTFKL